jgi:hypothetical protein
MFNVVFRNAVRKERIVDVVKSVFISYVTSPADIFYDKPVLHVTVFFLPVISK